MKSFKTKLLSLFSAELQDSSDAAYLWMVVPGGLLVGHPISLKRYTELTPTLFSDRSLEFTGEGSVFLPFDDVKFHSGGTVHDLGVALVDSEDVSACGIYVKAPRDSKIL